MDINEAVKQEWVEETDGFDRVQTVLRQTTQPKSAGEVAEVADVSVKTAKKHLDRLVELGVGEAVSTGDTSRYMRSRDWYVTREISRLREDHTKREIREGIERMLDEIEGYREKYGVETPEDMLVGMESDDDREEAWLDLSDWETTERNLAVARAAVRFEEASDLVNEQKA